MARRSNHRKGAHAAPRAELPSWTGSLKQLVMIIRPVIKGGLQMLARTPPRRRFQIVLIKPSHYDDEGYVVQWLRSPIHGGRRVQYPHSPRQDRQGLPQERPSSGS